MQIHPDQDQEYRNSQFRYGLEISPVGDELLWKLPHSQEAWLALPSPFAREDYEFIVPSS